MAKRLLAGLLSVMMIGCSLAAAESYYLELPAKGIKSTLNISVDIPEENPAINGVNPLTGEEWYGNYYPILVNIDTHPSALPHWGVASADIMYEMPLQRDGSTRSVALFLSEYPSYVGPVRSARVPMGSLREMWDGAWVFYGWQNSDGRSGELIVDVDRWALNLHDDVYKGSSTTESGRWYFPFINGTTDHYELYHRESDGIHKAPYNVQVDMQGVLDLFTTESTKHPYLFTETGLDRGVDVSGITLNYKTTNPTYMIEYKYNEETGLYDRYRDGAPYADALTGVKTAYANVIILRTDVSWYNNTTFRPVIQLTGQGVCEIFQNGKYIRGTWVRSHSDKKADTEKSLAERMVFFDENGNELEMKVGKTFIQIVDNEQQVIVTSAQKIEGAAPQATPEPTPTPKPTRKPKATRTPRASAQATPTPVIEMETEDEDSEFTFSFGI